MKPWLLVLAVAVGLSGCTLLDRQEKRINYTENLNSKGTPTLITDAKQRAIINVPANVYEGTGSDAGVKNHPTRIICAEPSPDVAQAISAAFTAAAQVDAKMADAAAPSVTQQISGSGSVGSAYASSIAQLGERLATVALLRDKMYRACEAYQNGAITDTSYTLLLSRFDKTMTSLLSAEMAAGAFGRNLAALGGSASTRGVDPKELADAKEGAKAAAKALSTAAALPDSDPTKKDVVQKAGADLDSAVSKLADLELHAAATAAQSGPGTSGVIGQIAGRSATDADAVARINANFLDDDASGSIIDACITALDRNRAGQTSQQLRDSTARIGQLQEQLAEIERSKPSPGAESAPPNGTNEQALRDDLRTEQAINTRLREASAPSLGATCQKLLDKADETLVTVTQPVSGSADGTVQITGGGAISLLQQNKLAMRKVEADVTKSVVSSNATVEKSKAAAAAQVEIATKIIDACVKAAPAVSDPKERMEKLTVCLAAAKPAAPAE